MGAGLDMAAPPYIDTGALKPESEMIENTAPASVVTRPLSLGLPDGTDVCRAHPAF